MLFKRIYPVPLDEPAKTRDGTIYLLRGLAYAGANTPKRCVYLFRVWQCLTYSFGLLYLPFGYIYNYILIIHDISPGEFLNSVQYALNVYSASVKSFIVMLHIGMLKDAINLMDEFDKRCKTREEFTQIRQNIAFCNGVFMVFGVMYTGFMNSSLLMGLITWKPPFNIYIPVIDWRADVWQFLAHTFIEYASVGASAVQAIGVDCYPVIFVNTLRTHLKLLTLRIKQLGTGETVDMAARRNELIACIKDHKRMLDYCELIRPCISGTIFLQFTVCGVILGLTVINMMFFMTNSSAVTSISYICALPFQTFPLCYSCNCLIDDCDELANAIFHSNWVDTDKNYQKIMLYYLQKTQKPMGFMPFNVFPITLATNITAAKFAITIFTLANNMNIKERWT